MTTTDARRLAEVDPVVILPLAAIEQHGPHLPVSTDLDITLGILDEAVSALPADLPIRILPALPIGASVEHERFPGTLSLDSELLASVIYAVGSGVGRTGARRLVLFNGHGGNRHVVERAGLRLRHECRLLVVLANYFDFPRAGAVDFPEGEWQHGLHGGAVETSMMLHLRPEDVRTRERGRHTSFTEELDGRLRQVNANTPVPFVWLAGDLNASGVSGDATLASAAAGERLVKHFGAVLADVIRDAHEFPVARLA